MGVSQLGGREDQEAVGAKTIGWPLGREGVELGITLYVEYSLACSPLIQQTLSINYMSLPQRLPGVGKTDL